MNAHGPETRAPATRMLPVPDGPSIALHDFGGDGSAVLLAHATGFHGLVWTPVAERLRDAGRHPYALDFRGHGTSDPSPAGYHWDGFRADVATAAEYLDLESDPDAFAVGHSMGGAALLLAESDRPGTFTSLYTFEPIVIKAPPDAAPDPDFFLATGARKRRAVFDSRADAYAAYAAKAPLKGFTPEALHAYVDHGFADRPDGTVELRCAPEVEAETFSMAPTTGLWAQLPAITTPVVVACGEHSDSITPPVATAIAARLRRGRVEVLPGLGHLAPMEDPDAVVRSILDFASAR